VRWCGRSLVRSDTSGEVCVDLLLHFRFGLEMLASGSPWATYKSCLLLLLCGLSFQVHLQKEFKNFFKPNRNRDTDQTAVVED
jgi:hypothetical protein